MAVFFPWVGGILLAIKAFIGRWALAFSIFIMGAFLKVVDWLRGLFGLGVLGAASTATSFSGLLVKLLLWQGLIWFCSVALTVLIGYFASDVINYLLDIAGVKAYVNELIEPIKKAGASFNKIGLATTKDGATSALGATNYVKVFEYFSFEKYLNYALATIFGFVALKVNIILFKAIQRADLLPRNTLGRF